MIAGKCSQAEVAIAQHTLAMDIGRTATDPNAFELSGRMPVRTLSMIRFRSSSAMAEIIIQGAAQRASDPDATIKPTKRYKRMSIVIKPGLHRAFKLATPPPKAKR